MKRQKKFARKGYSPRGIGVSFEYAGRQGALVAAALLALAGNAWAGQISSMEGDVDPVHAGLPNGEPAAYTWGDSFDANLVNHTESIVGVTDGTQSMHVVKPAGGFSWGTQYLFNNPAGDPRFADLVGAGTLSSDGSKWNFTDASSTKILLDISTPVDPNVAYSVGFGAVNYGGNNGFFLSSYNTSDGARNYQFATGPASQTALLTQTYTFDQGGMFTTLGAPLWIGLTNYVIYHFNMNSGTLAADNNQYWDNFRVVNENTATRATWKTINAGNWTDGANWNNGVPNGVGAPAIFYGIGAPTGTATLNATVNINSSANITVGSIILDSQITNFANNAAAGTITSAANEPEIVNYSFAGTGSLTFAVASGTAEIYVIAGSHNINVPVQVNNNLDIDTSAGFGPDNNASLPGGGRYSSVPITSLAFGAPITIASGATLKTRGAGTVAFSDVTGTSGGLTINGGHATLGGNVNVATLTIASSAVATVPAGGSRVLRTQNLNVSNQVASEGGGTITAFGTVNLNDHAMIVDYTGSSQLPAVQAAIRNAAAGGAWSGAGLTSSLALAAVGSGHPTALGYGEASALGVGTFASQAVDSTSVLVRYTYGGDANLDGKVNALDFNALASNFSAAGSVWTQGDFNYDGTVNSSDFTMLAQNFNLSLGPAGGAGLGALVPEPAMVWLTVLAVFGFRRRQAR